MKPFSEREAKKYGYDRAIFSGFEDKSFILNCVTYQHFIRDGVDFVVVEKYNKFNIIRKQKDFASGLV